MNKNNNNNNNNIKDNDNIGGFANDEHRPWIFNKTRGVSFCLAFSWI